MASVVICFLKILPYQKPCRTLPTAGFSIADCWSVDLLQWIFETCNQQFRVMD